MQNNSSSGRPAGVLGSGRIAPGRIQQALRVRVSADEGPLEDKQTKFLLKVCSSHQHQLSAGAPHTAIQPTRQPANKLINLYSFSTCRAVLQQQPVHK